MRPALGGHAGIPQETRLLFRGLSRLADVEVSGMLQSSTRLIAGGLRPSDARRSRDRQINRLSRVVVSLDAGGGTLPSRIMGAIRQAIAPAPVLTRSLLGLPQRLTDFEAEPFRDFIWRNLFAKTLRDDDFEAVTRARYKVLRSPWTAMHASGLMTRRFGHALYPRIDTRDVDVMIAETPFPGRVSKSTRLVVRYHDAIPLLMPHTISDKSYHQATHYHALRRNVLDGAWFACVSEATRRDLVSVFPQAAPRAITIPNMVSHHYHEESEGPQRIPEVLRIRRNPAFQYATTTPVVGPEAQAFPYLLMVSTIEPRKNHQTLLAAWERLRAQGFPWLHLVFVGSLGWDHKAIVKRFQPWLARGGLHMLEDVPSDELRLLYRHARVTVCPSFGEGFDYSGVEAMRCGGVVAASDIQVHRDVFGEAADYFNPYSSTGMAAVLAELLGPHAEARCSALRDRGARVSAQYTPEQILPQWQTFLDRLRPETGLGRRDPLPA
jgi:glycosyltransferase involved in cell wall biosynthesis